MLTIDEKLQALADDFELLGDDDAQLGHVMDLGRAMPAFSVEEQSDDNRVRGCASRLWMISTKQPDGTLTFRADSDALIPKGLAAIVIGLISGHKPQDILQFDLQAAFERLGLPRLSMSRASGLGAMVARIRRDAKEAI